ncbi:venom acid phosphatase Acph-1-like [Onthophagus taurus]|uniref:venom acid phosphatase Acph-1-like n=1 Tax=Onthophagus taurus TaxID=166361 RepID=UPI0039BE8C99
MDLVKEVKVDKGKKQKFGSSKWKVIIIILSISVPISLILKLVNNRSCPSIASNLNNTIEALTTHCFLESENHNTLILTQILFRHGDRTPMDHAGPYPKDPYKNYSYEPFGPGSLTNVGKKTLFGLGKYLKSYYCNLLKDYNRDTVYAQSSPFPRCRVSLLIVLAAMFPPQKSQFLANDLNWQPIPYESNEFYNDTTYLSRLNCKRYNYLYQEEIRKSIENNEVKNFKEILEKLFVHTGVQYTSYRELYTLSSHLNLQKEFGLQLPSWTEEFLPILSQFEILTYNISSRTEELKTLSGGFLLTEIMNAIKSKIHNPKMHRRKIHLYSGHDFSITNLLGTLGQYSSKHIPYASFVSFELHQINTEYAVKIFYYERGYDHPKPVILKGCHQELCPLDTFITYYGKYMATTDMCILDQ